ncbi:hypothetical protein V6Z11_A09G146800 [Gossypium hirsutum]
MAYVLIFTFGFAQNLFLIHAKDGPHPLLAVPRNSWNKLERGPRYRFDFVSSGKRCTHHSENANCDGD